MSGPTSPPGLRQPRGSSTSQRGRWVLGSGLVLAVCASQSNCGFPTYTFSKAGSGAGGLFEGGSAGLGPVGGAGNASGVGNEGGAAGSDGGASGASGASGVGADSGAGGDTCVYPAPVDYAPHCFNKVVDAGETGVNCGGSDCLPCEANQACMKNEDCASAKCTAAKTCSQVLTLQYASIVSDAFTRTPKFRLLLTYLSSQPMQMSDLRIRYYFNHNGVSEPVIALDTQATLDPGNAQMDISGSVRSMVHRFPPGPADLNGHRTDSFLEVTFTSDAQLGAGAKLDMTQDIVAGSTDVAFDQKSHYSFLDVSSLSANDAITVYRSDVNGAPQRVWGVDPPMNLLPDCAFADGVNVGGGTVTVLGQTLAASAEQLQFAGTPYSSLTPQPLPATDPETTTLLSTAFPLSDHTGATWRVAPGKYWAYAWLTSGAGSDTGTLFLQGVPADKFYGMQRPPSSAWALIGPYPVTVTGSTLELTAVGSVNVAGLALYRMQP